MEMCNSFTKYGKGVFRGFPVFQDGSGDENTKYIFCSLVFGLAEEIVPIVYGRYIPNLEIRHARKRMISHSRTQN